LCSVTTTMARQSVKKPSLRIASATKQPAQHSKALYAPASWRGSSDRRSTSGAY
jgi:hypothetical protein